MADNLSVSVTADTSELRAQLALAQADLKAFGAETRKLATEIRAGGDASGTLRSQLEQVAGQFGAAKGQVTSLSAALRDARAAHDEHVGGITATNEALRDMVAPIHGSIGGLKEFAEIAGIAFAVERVGEFARSMAELGERTLNSSAALGLSVQKYAELSLSMQLAGANAETAQRAMEKLAVSITTAVKNPASQSAIAFRNMGVSEEQLAAMSKDLAVALEVLAERWAALEEGPARTDVFREVIGRGLDTLIPLLRQGGEGFEELRHKSQAAADALARAAPQMADSKEKMNLLAQAVGTAGVEAFIALKPTVDAVTDSLAGLITKLTGATRGLREMIAEGSRGLLGDLSDPFRSWRAWWQGTLTAPGGAAASAVLPPIDVKARREKVGTATTGRGGGGRGRAAKDTSDADAKAAEQAALERLNSEEKVDDEILARRTKLIEAAKAAGKISLGQEIALLSEQLDRKWALDQDYFAKKIAAAQGDDKEQQKLRDQELIGYQQYLTKRQDLNVKYAEAKKAAEQKAAAASREALDKALAPIEKGFDQAIQGFLQGTQSLKQALQKELQAILIEPLLENLKNGLKTALGSAFSGSNIQGSLIGKFFSVATASDTAATTGSASATGAHAAVMGASSTTVGVNTVATATNTIATEINSAAETAGGGGGILGGIFGAIGKFLPFLAFEHGGIVPSAAGGWAVPSVGSGGVFAQLHSREMVLPADISQGLQGMIAGGGAGGPPVIHNWNISAVDGASVAKFFRAHGPALVAALNNATRNGSFVRQP